MNIQINSKTIPKKDFIALINNNKIQGIIHLRNIINISLKDAKDIVENLDVNPNYYDNTIINVAEKDIEIGESFITDINKNKPTFESKVKNENPFLIKDKNRNIKWFLIFMLLLFVWIYYFILQ